MEMGAFTMKICAGQLFTTEVIYEDSYRVKKTKNNLGEIKVFTLGNYP